MVEAEVEAGMGGEVGEPTIKATKAPVEGPWPCDEAAADEAGAVKRRAKPSMETRRGAEPTAAEPTAAELHPAPEAAGAHPTAEAGTREGKRWRAGQ